MTSKTVFLNIGFRRDRIRYDLDEGTVVPLKIDQLQIEHEGFPWPIDDQIDNLFFYMINDTNLPFMIDQQSKELILIGELDREKQNEYIFEIEIKNLNRFYAMKLQEDYQCDMTDRWNIDFQYTSKILSKTVSRNSH